MSEVTKIRLAHLKKTIAAGALFLFAASAIAGCGAQKSSETTKIENTPKQAVQTQESKTNQSIQAPTSTTNQTAQTQTTANKQGQSNPALKAAMDIIRLQRSQEAALTTSQCTSLKPILQELINTSNPTSDFLPKKAAAITALFTETQKTYLTQKPDGNRPQGGPQGNPSDNANGSTPPASPDGKTPPDGATAPGGGNPPDGRNKPDQMQPADIYKQALTALK